MNLGFLSTVRNFARQAGSFCMIAILLTATSLTITGGRHALATPIVANNTGVAQGALPDRSSAYQDQVLSSTAASGAKWIRLDLWWNQIEPTKGTYNWDKFDALYRKAHGPAPQGYGLNVLVVVTGSPSWASGCQNVANCPPAISNIQDWKNFLTLAVNRYKTSEFGITTYEIWNEPNITRFYQTPNASTYVNQVLKPAYEAITAALPSATVLTGGTAPALTENGNISPWEFVKNVYAAGGKNFFHHIAHHPYTQPDKPTDGNASWNSWQQMDEDEFGITSIRTSMNSNQDSAKQIWITEVGYPTHPLNTTCNTYTWDNNTQRCVTEAVQTQRLAQVYNEWSKKPWAGKIFWYAMLNDPASYYDSANNPEANFGLKLSNNTSKPAFDAFSRIVSESYVTRVKADAPRHYWKMGELSWTQPMKNEMNNINGYYISGTTLMGSDGTVVGTPSPTFLEAPNNRAEIDYTSDSVRLAGPAWTVEFNARRVGGTASWPGLMGRGASNGPDGWEIYVHHAGGDFVSFKRNNLECRTGTNALADGKSHHFAVTYASNTIKWYVDGNPVTNVGTCSVVYPTPSTTHYRLWIGASPASPGNNALGHVAIYNNALSATQVRAHSDAAVRLP